MASAVGMTACAVSVWLGGRGRPPLDHHGPCRSDTTMSTKLDLATKIAAQTGIEQQAVKQVVQMTLDGIIDVLASSGRLELRNFGVFKVRVRKGRLGRDPRTGAVVTVPAKRTVKFMAGKVMEERIEMDGRSTPPAGLV
jgi:nucleoid DNA-binding protein